MVSSPAKFKFGSCGKIYSRYLKALRLLAVAVLMILNITAEATAVDCQEKLTTFFIEN
jgi:hypothetical protein